MPPSLLLESEGKVDAQPALSGPGSGPGSGRGSRARSQRPSHDSTAAIEELISEVSKIGVSGGSQPGSHRGSGRGSHRASGPHSRDGSVEQVVPHHALDHSCKFFIEMDELEFSPPPDDPGGEPVPNWVESARWRDGLEEVVEYDDGTGAERFGTAHASGATMHGFFAFHSCLKKCEFFFDAEFSSLEEIADAIVGQLEEDGKIPAETKPKVRAAILAHHHHAASAERHAELENREERRRAEREKRMAAIAGKRRQSWVGAMAESIGHSIRAGSRSGSRAGSR